MNQRLNPAKFTNLQIRMMGHWSFLPLSTYRAYREKEKGDSSSPHPHWGGLITRAGHVLPTVGEGRRTCHR